MSESSYVPNKKSIKKRSLNVNSGFTQVSYLEYIDKMKHIAIAFDEGIITTKDIDSQMVKLVAYYVEHTFLDIYFVESQRFDTSFTKSFKKNRQMFMAAPLYLSSMEKCNLFCTYVTQEKMMEYYVNGLKRGFLRCDFFLSKETIWRRYFKGIAGDDYVK